MRTVSNHIDINGRQDHDLMHATWRFRPGDRIAFHFHGPDYGGNGKIYAKKGSPWPFNRDVIEAGNGGLALAMADSAFEGTVHYAIEFDLKDGTTDRVDPDMIIDRGGRRSLMARELSRYESAFEVAELLVNQFGFAPPGSSNDGDAE